MFEISDSLKEKLNAAESLDDVVKACAEEGIEVTTEQLEAELNTGSEGELSENALDNVSGGGVPLIFRVIGYYLRSRAKKEREK